MGEDCSHGNGIFLVCCCCDFFHAPAARGVAACRSMPLAGGFLDVARGLDFTSIACGPVLADSPCVPILAFEKRLNDGADVFAGSILFCALKPANVVLAGASVLETSGLASELVPNKVGLKVEVLSWVVGAAFDGVPKLKGAFVDADDAVGKFAKALLGEAVAVAVSF